MIQTLVFLRSHNRPGWEYNSSLDRNHPGVENRTPFLPVLLQARGEFHKRTPDLYQPCGWVSNYPGLVLKLQLIIGNLNFMWVKVFKDGPIKICGRQPLGRPYHFTFFKGCLPQILLGPFLNTLTYFFNK